MQIKDIVNRDLVNLQNCESEPIHIPGSIQPHGFLLSVHPENFNIHFCSANIADFTGLLPANVLGRSIADTFGTDQQAALAAYTALLIDHSNPFVLLFKETSYNVTVHFAADQLVLEAEPFPDGKFDLPNLYRQTSRFVAQMEGTNYLHELCHEIAAETRAITGYDRVMIYRFDKDYNGEVIAESRRDDLESFSGQKYPHTDIPVQARQLYIKNQLRMISDVSYVPVPLLTLNDGAEKKNDALDLSMSVLRSVSPIHIEYLKNMGVGATLTVSLLLNKQLWGLIACHHYSPKILPHYVRLSALLQGHFLTSQINVREIAADFEDAQKSEQHLNALLGMLAEAEDFIPRHHGSAHIRDVAAATGVLISRDGRLYSGGVVPEEHASSELIGLLTERFGRKEYHTDSLSGDFPQLKDLAKVVSGVIYCPLSNLDNDCIVWLRPEIVQTIKWAGNPYEKNDSISRLTPRKSFELWVEEVRFRSRPWKKSKLNNATNFAYALEKHNSLRTSRMQEERYRNLSEELKDANKELANVNWISTHDLKEPLRKIQIFASMVLEQEDAEVSEKVKNSVNRMRLAAVRMQKLIEDILSYSKAGAMEKIFVKQDLNGLLEDNLKELQDEIKEKDAVINVAALPSLNVIAFQVRQLFQNLLSNSLKFTVPGRRTEININSEIVKGSDTGHPKATHAAYYHISIKDNSIGFDQQHAQTIFEVFRRLHTSEEYPGTGIGLAICRKIMENHHGFINADSAKNEGTTMHLYFPAY